MDKALLSITVLGWCLWHIFAKLASQKIHPLLMQFIFACCATCMVPVFYLLLHYKGIKLTYNTTTMTGVGWSIACFVSTGIATMAYSYCLTMRQVSEIVSIASAYPILVCVLAVPIFGEAFTYQKFAGILLVWLGIVVLSR